MFYNTGISTYIWLVTNRKAPHRKGKVQLINGAGYFRKMRKSLGDKRKELSDEHIAQLARLYACRRLAASFGNAALSRRYQGAHQRTGHGKLGRAAPPCRDSHPLEDGLRRIHGNHADSNGDDPGLRKLDLRTTPPS